MNKTYAYIHNYPFPSKLAHSIYVAKTTESTSILGYDSFIIVSKRGYELEKTSWNYYGIKPKSFTILRTYTNGIFPPGIRAIFRRFSHPIATFIFAIQATKIAKQKHIDIIQTCDPEVIFALGILRKWYKPKVIFDIHLYPPKWIKNYLTIVDKFLITSLPFKDWLIEKGVETSKITVLPMGFSPEEYSRLPNRNQLKSNVGIDPKRIVVGYIGRYETLGIEKGIFQMIKVGNTLRKQIPITLLLVGGPEHLAQQYRHYAKSLGYNKDEILIHSQVALTDVPTHISACDVGWLVYPDNPRFRHAISPMKVLEYGAAKVPIIASNFPSITNQFSEEYVYLVEPGDDNNQVKTILEISSTSDSQKAKKLYDFIQQYSWVNRQSRILMFN